MCLYTDQEAPEDMTGVIGYKRYKIVAGSLMTPIMGYYVNGIVQMADPQDQKLEDKIPSIHKRIEGGYIHAYLNKRLGIYESEADSHSILVKGRFIGRGYRSSFNATATACAEGFELEEIVYETGDE